jgi:hypothetical protein
MTGPHDPDSAAYWRHLAEQAQAEAALYRGMVGQMQRATRELLDIWDDSTFGVVPNDPLHMAIEAVRATLARTR